MFKRADCQKFKVCKERFEKGGTDFTCEGCPGPMSTRVLSRWEIKELERKKRVEKKKEESKPPKNETISLKPETIKPKKEITPMTQEKEMSLIEKAKSKPSKQKPSKLIRKNMRWPCST